jgi:hypothetical protein
MYLHKLGLGSYFLPQCGILLLLDHLMHLGQALKLVAERSVARREPFKVGEVVLEEQMGRIPSNVPVIIP